MAIEGATGRLAVAGACGCLVIAGIAVAASPGRLSSSDVGWWLVGVITLSALVVLAVAGTVLLLRHPGAAARRRPEARERESARGAFLLILLVLGGLVWALTELIQGASRPGSPVPQGPALPKPPLKGPTGTDAGPAIGPWIVLGVAVIVVVGLLWVLAASLLARRTVAPVELRRAGDPLSAAVEAALLDLENESDARRAVIKAYARTESVLREHGLPRRPAEAPLEYLDRVLRELGARAGAVDRLTELFERAAFSQHEVGQDMRDEAVAVFLGLRNELAVEYIGRPEGVEL